MCSAGKRSSHISTQRTAEQDWRAATDGGARNKQKVSAAMHPRHVHQILRQAGSGSAGSCDVSMERWQLERTGIDDSAIEMPSPPHERSIICKLRGHWNRESTVGSVSFASSCARTRPGGYFDISMSFPAGGSLCGTEWSLKSVACRCKRAWRVLALASIQFCAMYYVCLRCCAWLQGLTGFEQLVHCFGAS